MSMVNAEKSLEYTQISFIWSKYWANIKQLWTLEILKYKQLRGLGLPLVAYKKSVSVILVKHSRKEKSKKSSL